MRTIVDDYDRTCWWCAGTKHLRPSALTFRDAGSKVARPCLVCASCSPKLRPELRGLEAPPQDIPRGTNFSLFAEPLK